MQPNYGFNPSTRRLRAVRNWSLLVASAWASVATPTAFAAPPAWYPHRERVESLDNSPLDSSPLLDSAPPNVAAAPHGGNALDMVLTSHSFPAGDVGDSAVVPANHQGLFLDAGSVYDANASNRHLWQWHNLPAGVVYPSYWAGVHESRISGVVFRGDDNVSLLDVTLGGRVALLRYGTLGGVRPEGWELGMEGAAFPRLNLDQNWDVEAVDFRFGVPITYGEGRWQWKAAFYHLSAHMGDEFAIREGKLNERINFSRDVLVAGVSYYLLPAWRFYAETGLAIHIDGGAAPWEFQVGVDIAAPGPTGPDGTPFAAINGHFREEHNYGGNLVVQAGWMWRGETASSLRAGFHYYNGKTNQFEFFDQFEQQVGAGIWYDF